MWHGHRVGVSPMCYLEPMMIRVFVDRVMPPPPHLKRKAGDTTVAMEMPYRLSVKE